MKKFLSILLAGVLLLCPILGSAAFSDAKESPWALRYIDYMEENDFIDGYEDGTFRPQQNITRAEFAKLLSLSYRKVYMREFDVPPSSPTDYMPYQDLPNDHWAYSYISDVLPFMNHYSENRSLYFHPDEPITREEAASAIGRSLSPFVPVPSIDFSFVETSLKDEADFDPSLLDESLLTVKWGLVTTYGLHFMPKHVITRAEMLAIFYRYLDLPIQPIDKYNPYELPIPVDYFPLISVSYMDEYGNTEVAWEINNTEELCTLINENATLLTTSPDIDSLAENNDVYLISYIAEKGGEQFFEDNYVIAYLSTPPYVFSDFSYHIIGGKLTISFDPLYWDDCFDETVNGMLYIFEIPKDSVGEFEEMVLHRTLGDIIYSHEIIR